MKCFKILSCTVLFVFFALFVKASYAEEPQNNFGLVQNSDFTQPKPNIHIVPSKRIHIEDLIKTASLKKDPDIISAYKELTLAYINTDMKRLKEEEAVLLKTNRISYFICFVAHFFLLFGVSVAYAEFRNSSRMRKKGEPEEQHEVKLGLEGIALKTSLHGTLILVITMAFYYLYLVHVYPIVILGVTS